MNRTGQFALFIFASAFAVAPLLSLSQTAPAKPSFEVISIKASEPGGLGIRGGGPRGERFTMTGATLKMLLQIAYQPLNSNGQPAGQTQIIGGPNWIDADRYEIQAKADCSAGVVPRGQMQLMIQSMLEERFRLKAHTETRELPVYNLVAAKDGPRLKPSADQTPGPIAQGGPQLCGPAPDIPRPLPPPPAPGERGAFNPSQMPRGAMMIMMSPTGMTMQANGVPLANLIGLLQQSVGRPVIDKTDLKGLFDFKLQFSPEGLTFPAPPGGPGPGLAPAPGGAGGPTGPATAAADPVPSLFTAIQELGLRLESAKAPVDVLVVDSAQKPTEN